MRPDVSRAILENLQTDFPEAEVWGVGPEMKVGEKTAYDATVALSTRGPLVRMRFIGSNSPLIEGNSMGVMPCGRQGCDEILCNRLIMDGRQYICANCFDELSENRKLWPSSMRGAEVRGRIETFMQTRPGATKLLDEEEVEAEFKRLTGNEWE